MAISTSSKIISMFMILCLIAPNTFATEYIVGDELGWTLGVDLQAWLSLKIFKVGDILHFNFQSPRTVAVVDLTAFLTCDASKALINDVSGSFNYVITKIGTLSFISAGPGDCAARLKLQIVVL